MDKGILDELRRRYAEPHRVHHGWARIGDMLGLAEEVAHGIAERTPFIFAVLFHNAVFDTRRADNEARSAALMRRLLAAATPVGVLARAEALILASARQEVPATEDASLRGDAALFLDIGQAELGVEEGRFDAHEAALRREYAHLTEDAYRAGRSSALQMLLWRDRIYLTDRFYLEWEKQAQRNVARAIVRLRGD